MQVLKLKIMKKITLIFLFFVLFHNVLQSQNFAPIGTKWRYDFSAFGQGAGIIEYEAQKDTILFGSQLIEFMQCFSLGKELVDI